MYGGVQQLRGGCGHDWLIILSSRNLGIPTRGPMQLMTGVILSGDIDSGSCHPPLIPKNHSTATVEKPQTGREGRSDLEK